MQAWPDLASSNDKLKLAKWVNNGCHPAVIKGLCACMREACTWTNLVPTCINKILSVINCGPTYQLELLQATESTKDVWQLWQHVGTPDCQVLQARKLADAAADGCQV
jgi:hypothetical protein